MKFSLSGDNKGFSVSSYAEGEFTVSGQVLTGSHFIWPDSPPIAWDVTDISDLSEDSFSSLKLEDIEAVIIGTGRTLEFPDDKYLSIFYEQSIGVEIMDTPAALRTYNILLSEDRKVMAALIPV